MPAGSQILTGVIINLKPNELFYSFTQAVHAVLEKKDSKSVYYAKLLKDAPQSYH
jgi:hypothetical protein